jgi:hypothetical protein
MTPTGPLWRMTGPSPARLGAADLIQLPSLTRGEPWQDYGPWPELLSRHGRAALAAAGYYLEHRSGADLGAGYTAPVVGLDADGLPAAVRAPIAPPVDERTPEEILQDERAGMRADRLWCELALIQAGAWPLIEAWANAPERTDVERRYWASAIRWRRTDPLVAAAAAAVGLSDADIDALFGAAMAMQAANT